MTGFPFQKRATMNQQPDKIFRDKLGGFRKNPPSPAWARIEGNLIKKNSRAFWLKIAASLLLISIAFTWVFVGNRTNPPLLSPTAAVTRSTPPVVNQLGGSRDSLKTLPKGSIAVTEKKAMPPLRKKKSLSIENIDPNVDPAERNGAALTEQMMAVTIYPVNDTLPSPAKKEDTSKRVRIVFTAGEINEKYLDKNSLAEATREDKKPSTLRRVLDKAYDLKHNQDPLGELRQKKNEILALHFKNEKQRNQNRQ